VGIPASFALDAVPLHGLEATEEVFDGTCHYVVDTRLTVGRGRPFVKDEAVLGVAFRHAFFKNLIVFPELGDLCVYFGQIESLILLIHRYYLVFKAAKIQNPCGNL
jgi:hypothetical protein